MMGFALLNPSYKVTVSRYFVPFAAACAFW